MAKKNNNVEMVITAKRRELAKAIDASTKTSKDVAAILNDIMVNEIYRDDNVDSFKAWFDKYNDNIEGIGYKQAKQLVDIHNYVWNHTELADIPSGVASALISACKKDADKVIALAKAKKITRNTPQKVVRELLVKEGLRKGDVTSAKAKACDDDIIEALAKFATFLKKAKADDDTLKAFDILKEAIDK